MRPTSPSCDLRCPLAATSLLSLLVACGPSFEAGAGGGATSITTTSTDASASTTAAPASASAAMTQSATAQTTGATASGSTGTMCAEHCIATFAQSIDACLDDTDPAGNYGDADADEGVLTLDPDDQTGFGEMGIDARLLYVTLPEGVPFAAVTVARVHGPGSNLFPPGVPDNLAGLAVRRAGHPIPDGTGWLTHQAGALATLGAYGVRLASNEAATGMTTLAESALPSGTPLLDGVQLALCRYSTGDLGAFYRTNGDPAWISVGVMPPHREPGMVDVGLAANASGAAHLEADFPGLAVFQCAQLDESGCLAELDQLAASIPF